MSKHNPIFSYKAGDELVSDAWNTLVTSTFTLTDAELGPTFKAWEGEYKEATGLPLPGAWRSAKSVIKNARAWHVPLTLPSGVKGKTAVEKEIKAAKGGAGKSPTDRISAHIKAIENICKQAGLGFGIHHTGEYVINVSIEYAASTAAVSG